MMKKISIIAICLLTLCATTFCKKQPTTYIKYVDYFYNALEDTVGLRITSASYGTQEQAFVQRTSEKNQIYNVQSGVKNKKLWVGVFEKAEEHRYRTIYEWTGGDDIEPLISDQEEILVANSSSPYPYSGFGYIDNSKLFLIDFKYRSLNNYESYILAIDAAGNHKITKHTSGQITSLRVWANDHYYVWDNVQRVCINSKGETQFELKSLPLSTCSSLSVQEGVDISIIKENITKYNFESGKTEWQKDIIFPGVANDAEYYKYELTNKSSNIWTYKVYIVLLSTEGIIRNFSIDTDDGVITYL